MELVVTGYSSPRKLRSQLSLATHDRLMSSDVSQARLLVGRGVPFSAPSGQARLSSLNHRDPEGEPGDGGAAKDNRSPGEGEGTTAPREWL